MEKRSKGEQVKRLAPTGVAVLVGAGLDFSPVESTAAALVCYFLAGLWLLWLYAEPHVIQVLSSTVAANLAEGKAPADATSAGEADTRPAFHAVLDELITIRARLNDVERLDAFTWDFELPAIEWEHHRHLIATHASGETRRRVGTAYINADRVNRYARVRDGNGSDLDSEDKAQLKKMTGHVTEAIEALEKELEESRSS